MTLIVILAVVSAAMAGNIYVGLKTATSEGLAEAAFNISFAALLLPASISLAVLAALRA